MLSVILNLIQNPPNLNKRLRIKPGMAFLICLFSYLFIGLFPAMADTMSNGNYILELNKTSPQETSTQFVPPPTPINDPRVQVYDGYVITQGFPYVFGVNNFAFTISSLVIDFGSLSPTNPIIRTNMLSVSPGSSYGYEITALEDHELQLKNGETIIIPNTTCDDGLCSENYESAWLNTLTFGFGYRCDGADCIIKKQNAFRDFPVTEDKKTSQAILAGTSATSLSKAQITYKVNVPTTQSKGLYENIITFTALPGY